MKQKKITPIRTFLLVLLLVAGSKSAFAGDTIPAAPPLSITGSVDAFYRYGGNGVGSATSFTTTHNSITLGMANVSISKDFTNSGFMVDLIFGRRAEEFNYNYDGKISQAIKQLYFYYKPSKDIKLTMGSWNTHVGYEVPEAVNNLNYSMSYMFTHGPFFHTGVKGEFALSDKFTLMLGVFSNTDTKGLASGDLHLGGQLAYVNGNFKGYLNYLTGNDTAVFAGTPAGHTTGSQIDVVATYQLTTAFGLGVNYTNKSSDLITSKATIASNWSGLAVYANYAISPTFTLAGRYENFNDKDGFNLNTVGATVDAFTLSGNIKLDKGNIILIPEVRFDSSNKSVYTDNNGKAQTGESSFIFAAVYKF